MSYCHRFETPDRKPKNESTLINPARAGLIRGNDSVLSDSDDKF